MGIIDYVIGRLGLSLNPETGRRVRVRSHGIDDWGNTRDHIEEQNREGSWTRKDDVLDSSTGGHYQ